MGIEFLAAHLNLVYELAAVFGILVAIIGISGVLISRFDRIPLGEAIYFAFITAFTVGFGDVAPRSHATRVVTVFLALLGLVLVGVIVAVAVHALDLAMTEGAIAPPSVAP